MNPSDCAELIRNLESDPRRSQPHYPALESAVASYLDEIFRLADTGEDDERKMRIVLLEKRARELLKRWHLLNAN